MRRINNIRNDFKNNTFNASNNIAGRDIGIYYSQPNTYQYVFEDADGYVMSFVDAGTRTI